MKIISHKGLSHSNFENSLSAIRNVLQLDVDYIEIDVWKTKDNKLIVFHDPFYDTLTTGSGFVEDMTHPESLGIKLKNGEDIPSLEDVILLTKGKVPLIVEVKSENSFSLTVETLKANLSSNEYIIASFFHESIQRINKENSDIQTAIVFEAVPMDVKNYLEKIIAEYIAISIETYNDALIEAIHSTGKKLIFYGTNNTPQIVQAIRENPYGIITDFPELAKEYFDLLKQ